MTREDKALIDTLSDRCTEFRNENYKLKAALRNLMETIEKVQDWSGTHVGEAIEQARKLA